MNTNNYNPRHNANAYRLINISYFPISNVCYFPLPVFTTLCSEHQCTTYLALYLGIQQAGCNGRSVGLMG